jgi:membrane-associated protease RseP (regulator of RpoE activity)
MRKFTNRIATIAALAAVPIVCLAEVSVASAKSISVHNTSPAPSFPKIITMSMNHFSKSVLRGAEAPTIFPAAASGSVVEYYKTSSNTQPIMGYDGFQASYNVELSSPTATLAYFNGARFQTADDAAIAFVSSVGNAVPSGQKSEIPLGSGHIATITVNNTVHTSSITWAEGRWNILVANAHGTTPETTIAKDVVSYLQKNFMPVPLYKAAIQVTVEGKDVQTNVVWQRDNEIYTIDTYSATKAPVTTALAMTISMRPYN